MTDAERRLSMDVMEWDVMVNERMNVRNVWIQGSGSHSEVLGDRCALEKEGNCWGEKVRVPYDMSVM